MNIVVFEDEGVPQLAPITLGRPAYAISCASFRLVDWLNLFDGVLIGLVRPHLETLQLHNFPSFVAELDRTAKWTLAVNARMVPSRSNFRQLQQLVDRANPSTNPSKHASTGQPQVVRSGWAIAAALIPTEMIEGEDTNGYHKSISSLGSSRASDAESVELPFELFEYPHDVVRQNLGCFADNMQQRLDSGKYIQVADGVFVADGVLPPANVALDASQGPIVIESNVSFGPFVSLRGPVYLGANAKISEHAAIKDEVSVGHTCKVGGEVEACVIEPYSNKQHYGFLGHCYIGSWVNMGAGTCNSDLKNTYGRVNMVYGGTKVATGMQFMGCVIGDYAKTAINTSIFTGKQIGVGSMVYGWVTENVPSFVNHAKSLGSVSLMPANVIIKTQERMFARRKVSQRPCDRQLINDMFRLTAANRSDELLNQPPKL